MSWTWAPLAREAKLPDVIGSLNVAMRWLMQSVADSWPVRRPIYGATVAIDAQQSAVVFQKITVTNGVAFTVSKPTSPVSGRELVIEIANGSGGAMGAVTWDAVYRLAGAFVAPANAKSRIYRFYYDGTSWKEMGRSAADL